YQVIKAGDEHLKFVFLTGVSQFSGLSIFSGLNNLENITMSEEFSSICGYTQEEFENNFKEHIEKAATANEMSEKEILSKIKYYYNGYSWDGKISVYNPFSALLFLKQKKFNRYWFASGTPTFLIEQIKKKDNLESFVQKQAVMEDVLSGFAVEEIETTALLFQTGYLTIKKEEETMRGSLYTLDFPNFEVKDAFLTSLIKVYTNKTIQAVYNLNDKLYEALIGKDAEKLTDSLTELYASIPYNLHITKEAYYHSLFLVTCRLAGFDVEAEVHTNKGRIDVVLKKDNIVIIVEIKYGEDKSIEVLLQEAISQIKDKKYYEKYIGNEVILLALTFGRNKEIGCKFKNL
ncbi:MAG: ATP-binding protein, partial [Endomicrobium sp.]|nr:ATP-binding protein [Endomicrobium sp.]